MCRKIKWDKKSHFSMNSNQCSWNCKCVRQSIANADKVALRTLASPRGWSLYIVPISSYVLCNVQYSPLKWIVSLANRMKKLPLCSTAFSSAANKYRTFINFLLAVKWINQLTLLWLTKVQIFIDFPYFDEVALPLFTAVKITTYRIFEH